MALASTLLIHATAHATGRDFIDETLVATRFGRELGIEMAGVRSSRRVAENDLGMYQLIPRPIGEVDGVVRPAGGPKRSR